MFELNTANVLTLFRILLVPVVPRRGKARTLRLRVRRCSST